MRIGRLNLDRHFLESRVARRMFAVVAASALLPVAAFAVFAYGQVREQLETDAARLLRRESKAAGMAILERLFLAADAMRLHTADGDAGTPGAPLTGAVARSLHSLRAVPGDDRLLAGLSDSARSHLARGNTLLVVEPAASGNPAFLLLRLRLRWPADTGRGAWTATVDPDFIFTPLWRSGTDRYRITDAAGDLLFWTPIEAPPERTGRWNGPAEDGVAKIVHFEGRPWLAARWNLFLGASFGAHAWEVEVARPLDEIHRPLREFDALFPWIAGIALLGALGLTLFQVRRSLVPITALAEGARRLGMGDLHARVSVESRDEFGELSHAFNEMAGVIEHQIDVLATVNKIGAALSAERDGDRLLELIVRGSMQVTLSNIGALFLLNDEGVVDLSSVHLQAQGAVRTDLPGAALPLAAARRCVERRELIRVNDLSGLDLEERRGFSLLGEHLDHPVCAYLAVPLQAGEDSEAIGSLLLMSDRHEAFSDAACSLARSLASQAAVSIRKNRLVESFRSLFEGLIQLTAKAIDEKSPYTGDHCRKVPIITELLADAACATTEGPLKDFAMTADERYELRIAALLHDCGKVVTPVHVMDKATKLETIFDRIELVATRFDVLRRDAAIRSLAGRLGQAEAQAHLTSDPELARELAQIDEDLAFLRSCNKGSEAMPESHQERVRAIAGRYPWTPSGREACCVLDANEVENLSIAYGTLTKAEREIINQHVVTTISLLEELPFPRHMRAVPAIAGAHHERLDGRGYPLGLEGGQLGIQARILGLADVFEALTASDRPYKPARTLTETLELIEKMCQQGHIDADLFELMVREKVHLRYAAEHLSPEQIDAAHREDLERLTRPWGSA